MKPVIVIMFAVFAQIQMGCATMGGGKADQPPEIRADMPLERAFQHAINYGGSTLEEVKRLVKARDAWPELEAISAKYLKDNVRSASPSHLLNGVHLYRVSSVRADPELIRLFFRMDDTFYQRVAWQLAALKPSPEVASLVDSYLTERIARGQTERVLLPEMARAVQANQLRSVYTIVREGLFYNGSDDFAKAMIMINPDLAANDFVDYLAQASLEDLRQINQTNVNMYTSLVILRFFMNYPLPVENANIGHIYYYAISRNPALTEMARDVLEQQIPRYRNQMTFILARQPMAVQMAFVEGTRHYPSANVHLLLSELRDMTAFEEVEDEIRALTRH